MQLGPLVQGTLKRRYKRFLADVDLQDGQALTVHCPNTGAMTGCAEEHSAVWLSRSDNPKRKYAYTWELVDTAQGMACINTGRANAVVGEALRNRVISELASAGQVQREVRSPVDRSRFDFGLGSGAQFDCFVEVKSVTLCAPDGKGYFPDAVSQRALKHVNALIEVRNQGLRAVLLFCAQHSGVRSVHPASQIQPAYAQALAQALDAGVEVLAYACEVTPDEVRIAKPLPFTLQPSG